MAEGTPKSAGSKGKLSPNKELVLGYYASTGTEYGRLLAEDVVLVDWDPGVPAGGAVTSGKDAYLRNRGERKFRSEIVRMTEEGSVVIVEGFARGSTKTGRSWTVHFVDAYDISNGKIQRASTHGVEVKEPA